MSNIIHLDEIRLAKKIVKDVPNIINNLDKCLNLVYPYSSEYIDAHNVMQQILDSRLMLEIIYEAYKIVLEEHGVKSDNR